MPAEKQVFTGPARVFDGEEACFEAVQSRTYKEGDVLVIRYEGPRGGPGMREMLSTTAALYGQGMGDKVALITGRALLRRHPRLLRRPCRPRGGGGGPIGLIRDGDIITLDAIQGTLSVALSDEDSPSAARPGRRGRTPRPRATCGNTRRASARPVRRRHHPGGAKETESYADV